MASGRYGVEALPSFVLRRKKITEQSQTKEIGTHNPNFKIKQSMQIDKFDGFGIDPGKKAGKANFLFSTISSQASKWGLTQMWSTGKLTISGASAGSLEAYDPVNRGTEV